MKDRAEQISAIQLHKMKLYLLRNGMRYDVERKQLNDYGEPIRDENGKYKTETILSFVGLFHTSNSFVSESVAESSITKTKQQPQILSVYEDVRSIMQGDILTVANCVYEVVEVRNISNMGIVADISLQKSEMSDC